MIVLDSIDSTVKYILSNKGCGVDKQCWIGIVGPPATGKSYIASCLKELLSDAITIPMDGYHYYKSELCSFDNSREAFERRGAPFTFNAQKFYDCIQTARESGVGSFPAFDHLIGDPQENVIHLSKDHKYVMVEGNYLLLDEDPWCQLRELFDIIVYIETPVDIRRQRLIERHVAVGLDSSSAMVRTESNDILNGELVDKTKHFAGAVLQLA